MKKILVPLMFLCFAGLLQAQLSKTVTAGGLSTALTADEKANTTNLILSGSIDARDFKTMRDDMPKMVNLDISSVTIAAFSGPEGTFSYDSFDYIANRIPEKGFEGKMIKSIIFPQSLTSIGSSAFFDCGGLSSITVPSLVTSINGSAFEGCYSLKKVILPEGLISIGGYAFSECDGLSQIVLPSQLSSIGSNAFDNCGMSTLIIPKTLTTIPSGAFENCHSLKTVTIPSTVTSLGGYAFADCENLTSIYAENVSPIDLSSSSAVFEGVDKTLCTLYVPSGSIKAYRDALQWKDFTNIVGITPTSINKQVLNPINATIQNNQVIIKGIVAGTVVTIYDIQGKLIYRLSAKDTDLTLNLPARGRYVLQAGMSSVKVAY